MKNFSKSKLRWIFTFGATALLCFVCALTAAFGSPTRQVSATDGGTTYDVVYDYNTNGTVTLLNNQLKAAGYTLDSSITIDTTEVLVGNTYTVTDSSGSNVTVTITAPQPVKVEDIVSQTTDVNVGTNGTLLDSWGTTGTQTQSGTVYAYKSSDENNANNYGGNLSIYTTTAKGGGVNFVGANSFKYGLLQVRTEYSRDINYTLGLMRGTTYNSHYHEYTVGGYYIRIDNANKAVYLGYGKAASDAASSSSTYTDTKQTFAQPTEGSSMLITYGVYPKLADTGTVYVFQVIGVLAEDPTTSVFNKTWEISQPSGVVFAENAIYFSFGARYKLLSSVKSYAPVTIEGVEKPLLSTFSSTYPIDASYDAGTKLSEISIDGVTFANQDDTVTVGANSHAANIAYYNTGKTFESTVTFNGVESYDDTIEVTYDYSQYETLSNLNTLLTEKGYAFGAGVDTTAAVMVGEAVYPVTDSTGAAKNVKVVVKAPTEAKKIESIITSTDHVKVAANNEFRTAWITDGYEEGANFLINDIVTDDARNANTYGGNLSLYSSNTTGSIGAVFKPEKNSKYGLIQVRTQYTENAVYNFGLLRLEGETHGFHKDITATGGYSLRLSENKVSFFKVLSNGTAKTISSSSSSGASTLVTIEEGAQLLITYGVYQEVLEDGSIVNKIVFRGEYNDTVYFDKTYTDETPTDLTDGEFFDFGMRCSTATTITIEGVDKPLFEVENPYRPTITDQIEEEVKLSTVTLPDNYTWSNGETLVDYSVKAYPATYSDTYYATGTSISASALVTLSNINPKPRAYATFRYGDQDLVTLSGKTGQVINFADVDLSSVTGTVPIGWKLDGVEGLYSLKRELAVTEEMVGTDANTMVYNLVTVDFKVYDGAAIRTQTTDGKGGLRFLVMVNSADIGNYVTGAYGVIAPSDTYVKDGVYTVPNKVWTNLLSTTAFTAKDVHFNETAYAGYNFYTFALTNIKYHNYNRQFAAMTYITVQYEDGTTANFQSNYIERSVYDVALMAMTDETSPFEEAYAPEAQETIKGYVENVIEVSYDVTDTTTAVVTTLDQSLTELVKPYTEGTAVIADSTLTITLTVSTDSIFATVFADNDLDNYVPVVVSSYDSSSDNDAVKTYYQVAFTYVDLNDGTATVTITLTLN